VGLLSRGLLALSAFKLGSAVSLDDIQSVATSLKYTNLTDKPTPGWGAINDEPFQATSADSSQSLSVGTPALVKSHAGLSTLAMRLYFDVPLPALRKRLGADAEWREYHQRSGVDVLLLQGVGDEDYSVLASSRNPTVVNDYFRPAMDTVLAHVPNGSTLALKQVPVTEEFEPDLFLWLFYKHHKGMDIANDVTLGDIDQMQTRGGSMGWRSHYSRGASGERQEILVHVAKGDAFGPARLSLNHFSPPEGFFEVKLELDGGFTVFRPSRYDDEDLEAMPATERARHMVEDLWQTILPKVRDAHRTDSDWRETERDEFIEYARSALQSM
jgi:hypothetical protein